MKILDANMILRYLIQDNVEMAEQVKQILKTEKVLILPEVLSEVAYVMIKVYHYDRVLTAEGILKFLNLSMITMENPNILKKGTELFRDTSLDFVDCLLASYHTNEGHEICTFDKKLNRLMKRLDSESGDSD